MQKKKRGGSLSSKMMSVNIHTAAAANEWL